MMCIHEDIRHNIRDYRYLKKEIKELLSKEYLENLVGDANKISKVRTNRYMPQITIILVGMQVARIDENVLVIHSIHEGPNLNDEPSMLEKDMLE